MEKKLKNLKTEDFFGDRKTQSSKLIFKQKKMKKSSALDGARTGDLSLVSPMLYLLS